MASPAERLQELERLFAELREQVENWQEGIDEFQGRTFEHKATSTGEFHLRELVLLREQMEHRLPELQNGLTKGMDELQKSLKDAWTSVIEEYKQARKPPGGSPPGQASDL